VITAIALIVAFLAAAVLTVTGFGWFGSSTDVPFGWAGLALTGIVVAMAGLDGRWAARRHPPA
jgi:hypothetical protein